MPISSKGARGCAYRTAYEYLTRLESDGRVMRRKLGTTSVWKFEEWDDG